MPSATSTDPGTARRSPRERLLEAAGELFYAEGIQSVGIDRVIERAGVAKASLYSTFGSKEELVGAYLDERHARIIGRLRAAVDAVDPADPVARILAVFDAQAEIFRAPDYHGCAFTAAAAEAPRGGRIDEADARLPPRDPRPVHGTRDRSRRARSTAVGQPTATPLRRRWKRGEPGPRPLDRRSGPRRCGLTDRRVARPLNRATIATCARTRTALRPGC